MTSVYRRRRTGRASCLVLATMIVCTLAPARTTSADPVVAAAYRTHAVDHLRAAVTLGQRALAALNAAQGHGETQEAIGVMRAMLDQMKHAIANLDVVRHESRFLAPLLEFQMQRGDETLGLIRHGLDHRELPWPQYIEETVPRLQRATAIAEELLDSVP